MCSLISNEWGKLVITLRKTIKCIVFELLGVCPKLKFQIRKCLWLGISKDLVISLSIYCILFSFVSLCLHCTYTNAQKSGVVKVFFYDFLSL